MAGSRPLKPRSPLTVPITVGGDRVRSETLISVVGPSCVVLETSISQGRPALLLTSVYAGQAGVPTTVTHLGFLRGAPSSRTEQLDERVVPVERDRLRCVLDHVQALAALAETAGYVLAVDTFAVDDDHPALH